MSADGPDLVIAGAGGGLAGALRAAELGLDVLVVEVSEHFRRGNNTSMSTAMVPGAGTRFQAAAGIDDSPDLYVSDIRGKTHGEAAPQPAEALAQVSAHNVQSDCWAAVKGSVYDLTGWIAQHPGGPEHIIPLCGTDATAAFTTQHDGQSLPNERLGQFKIGTLTT